MLDFRCPLLEFVKLLLRLGALWVGLEYFNCNSYGIVRRTSPPGIGLPGKRVVQRIINTMVLTIPIP